jgi:hypothetical protein
VSVAAVVSHCLPGVADQGDLTRAVRGTRLGSRLKLHRRAHSGHSALAIRGRCRSNRFPRNGGAHCGDGALTISRVSSCLGLPLQVVVAHSERGALSVVARTSSFGLEFQRCALGEYNAEPIGCRSVSSADVLFVRTRHDINTHTIAVGARCDGFVLISSHTTNLQPHTRCDPCRCGLTWPCGPRRSTGLYCIL